MANPYFHFKQFTINQERCAMKVNTDAVLLGILAEKESPRSILDVGSGTGVISLMLAQRFPNSKVSAVEIDDQAYLQAHENINGSPFKDRVTLVHNSFQEYYKEGGNQRFDLIVSNPPFYTAHLKATDSRRNLAIHNDKLPSGDLIKGVVSLLDFDGVFWVILPPRQMRDLEKIADFFHLKPYHTLFLKESPSKKVFREIIGFSFSDFGSKHSELCIKTDDGSYSNDYRILLKEFLTIF